MSQEALLVLGPEHAAIATRQGFDKERTRQTLFEHARIPFAHIGQNNADVLSVWRAHCIDEADGQRTLRIVEKPEDILIVVAGGAGNHSASIPGWYSRSVTLPITRADGAPIHSVAELGRTTETSDRETPGPDFSGTEDQLHLVHFVATAVGGAA